jgi:predicted Zn-dependent protease
VTMNRRQFTAALRAGAAVTILPGCISTNKATGRTSFTGTMTPEAEVEVGDGEHPKLLQAFGGEYDNVRLQGYVDGVGKRLTTHTEYRYPYRFTLLNSPIVNAFALPGGNVYVSRGLLALASNEAEMAGVLAHELGHVNARHSAERYGAQQATSLGIGGARILASLFLDLPASMLNAGTQLAQSVAGVALQSYSRQQEFEADSLAVRYMSKSGYEPDAMVTFLATLREQSILDARARGLPDGAVDESNMMSTHPRTIDRVQAATLLAETERGTKPVLNREAYLARIDGMLYGDDPAQGMIQGQRFVHPGMALAFEVPAGFRLHNSPERVVATNGRGASILFDMAPTRSAGDLPGYIGNEWAEGARLAGLESITINGLNAATGSTTVQTNSGQADARLVAIENNLESVFRLTFISPRDATQALSEDYRRATYSFKRLGSAEARAVQPLRLRVRKAESQSVRNLATALPYGSQNEEWFRVLNDLPEGGEPEAGATIKTFET